MPRRISAGRIPSTGTIAPLALGLALVAGEALADCRVLEEPRPGAPTFVKHLGEGCTREEREHEAVTGDQLLQALREGSAIDLLRVVVTGDLNLNALPPVPWDALGADATRLRDASIDGAAGTMRLIPGAISIRQSQVRGEISTSLREGRLIIRGPVNMAGTSFDRMVDLTRTVFLEPVEFSDATFESEALFVQARFLREARFEGASFGIRARFHRSRFLDRAEFRRADFQGMAEFLQVTFDQGARFDGARFRLGSGFSGSLFGGTADFSDTRFEREVFFLHTVFREDARFPGATFLGFADFSEAQFQGLDDFSTALFEKEPRFSGITTAGERVPSVGALSPAVLYGAATFLAAATIIVLWRWRRRPRGAP